MSDAPDEADANGRKHPVTIRSEAELDTFLDAHDVVVVEFFTEGCGICASMEPVLGLVARASDAVVALVNPRDDPPLIERFDIRCVPTLALFVDGEEVTRRAEGFVGAEDLVEFVETHVEVRSN